MNTLKVLTTLATMLLAAGQISAHENSSACTPTIIALRTDFPAHAQQQRQHGNVRLAIQLGSEGRVIATRVVQSSGHAALDREVDTSARKHWHFDVKHCSVAQLAQDYIVSVTYRRPPGPTLSGTINRKALARMQRLLADNRCLATKPGNDALVFACLDSTRDTVTVRR
jgi:TonB family protein